MSREYIQQRYRAAEGRFDGNLNKMAREGWTLESINQVDDLFLVTYSRPTKPELKIDRCVQRELEHVIDVNLRAGNQLVQMTASPAHFSNLTLYTLVWEITRDGEQESFDVQINDR